MRDGLPSRWLPSSTARSSAARTPGSSWGPTRRPCFGSGGKNAAKPSLRISLATSSSSSGSQLNRSIGAGTSAIPGRPSKRSNALVILNPGSCIERQRWRLEGEADPQNRPPFWSEISLALASLNHACRVHRPDVSATLTTMSLITYDEDHRRTGPRYPATARAEPEGNVTATWLRHRNSRLEVRVRGDHHSGPGQRGLSALGDEHGHPRTDMADHRSVGGCEVAAYQAALWSRSATLGAPARLPPKARRREIGGRIFTLGQRSAVSKTKARRREIGGRNFTLGQRSAVSKTKEPRGIRGSSKPLD